MNVNPPSHSRTLLSLQHSHLGARVEHDGTRIVAGLHVVAVVTPIAEGERCGLPAPAELDLASFRDLSITIKVPD